jgi:hypothetical protein
MSSYWKTLVVVFVALGAATAAVNLQDDPARASSGDDEPAVEGAVVLSETPGTLETPCDRFSAAVESNAPIAEVIRQVGLPEDVRVTGDPPFGKLYCFSRSDDSGNGIVDGVGIVDSSNRIWLILSRDAVHAFNAADPLTLDEWLELLGMNGFPGAVRFEHGFTTAPATGGPIDLWSAVDRDMGR